MTITITTGNKSVTDFIAYLDDFDENFTPSGRGTFSEGIGGDYGASETDVTETPDSDAQGYVLRDNINYSMTTHTLSGTISSVDFGYGLTAVEQEDSTSILELDQLDYTVEFSPEVSDGDDVHDVIYGFLGYGEDGEGRTDALAALLSGDDILFLGAGGDDVFSGYRQADTLKGRGGDDTLSGQGGKDMLKGNAGDDTLSGGDGADMLKGGGGHDDLDGGAGKDKLDGGVGKDVLNGGAGKDVLTGGVSKDTFEFTGDFGRDIVTDFNPGKDTLDLSGLTDEATSFAEFLDAATQKGGRVIYDLDGDGDNVIVLRHTSLDDLSASDFLF